jgi:beta-glucosidase
MLESILGLFSLTLILTTFLIVHRLSKRHPEVLWDWDSIDVQSTLNEGFPEGFMWGTATAAFQVEGRNAESNWTMWENATDSKGRPRIHNGQKVGLSCDHFSRYPEDIRRMREELGIDTYRFSLAWSRIEPEPGHYNQDAIDHYSRLIDCCLENGIKPMVTLHHFTHPLWFEKIGSFEKRENIQHFVRFAHKVFGAYSDRAKLWCTHNECGPFATMGWGMGAFPPGKNSVKLVAQVLLNLMHSHSEVYHGLKGEKNGDQVQIGLVKNIFQFDPWSRWNPIHWMLCRVLDRVYNESLIGTVRDGHFSIKIPGLIRLEEELPEAKGATDFIGLNYYSNLLVNLRRGLDPFKAFVRPGQISTDFPYATYPEGFYRAIHRINQLNTPIIITENGIPDNLDDRRADWINRYAYAMKRAMNEGVDVRGYLYWSLLDNFEWAEGYDMRFGLYEVDFKTQKRTLRDGALPFAALAKRARNGSES